MKSIIALLGTMILAGCVSQQQIIAEQSMEDDRTCTSYGLKFGSPEYAQCRQNIANRRAFGEQAYRLAEMQNLQNMQANEQLIAQQQIASMGRQKQQTQCVSNNIGGYVYTNCN